MKFTLSRILKRFREALLRPREESKEIEGGCSGVTFQIMHEENFVTKRFPSFWRSEEKCEEISVFLFFFFYNRSENANEFISLRENNMEARYISQILFFVFSISNSNVSFFALISQTLLLRY